MKNSNISPNGTDWEDLRQELFTTEEIAACDIRVALVGEIIRARRTQGVTQKKLEEMSGVKQPVIARLERGTSDPQLSTILKLLTPLGKTLAIVPLDRPAQESKLV